VPYLHIIVYNKGYKSKLTYTIYLSSCRCGTYVHQT